MTHFRLDENMHRIDTTTAHTSVREAFANCIIHCAYTVMGNIMVDRYFNRIVLSNPGTMLVSKVTLEMLRFLTIFMFGNA